ncbi:DUF6783 domain-containing protein [Ruminococcus sp. Marseille-P328]|uniref:DUF6783 domain-containing protein n=1 Tax=Ruminococcus sp. Marseille-P328 TaxID=1816688 RepID=UPI003567B26D
MRAKYTAKRGVQIGGMIFQTGSGIRVMVTDYHKNVCIIYSSFYTLLTFYVQNCQNL